MCSDGTIVLKAIVIVCVHSFTLISAKFLFINSNRKKRNKDQSVINKATCTVFLFSSIQMDCQYVGKLCIFAGAVRIQLLIGDIS